MRDRLIKLLKKPMTGILISVLIGFIVGAVVLAVAGYNPLEAYGAMFAGMFRKPKYVSQIVINAGADHPDRSIGLLRLQERAFQHRRGGAVHDRHRDRRAGWPLLPAADGRPSGGGPAAGLPLRRAVRRLAGWLKARFGVHEVISTIMLNWIALYFNNFILTLPGVKKPGSQASYEVADTAKLLFLGDWKKSEAGKEFIKSNAFWGDFLRTDLHWGILLALVVVLLAWYYLNHTTKGFELRAVGANKDAAEFAGIGVKKNMVMAMFISGGIAALAGAIQILGTNPFRISVLPVTEGYGWDGISVSLIANNNPLGCVLSGLLFSGLKYGGGSIQSEIGAPSEIINIMIGSIVFCVALVSIYPMIAERLKRRGGSHVEDSLPDLPI